MKRIFTSLFLLFSIGFTSLLQAQCTDLFISEYIEGSSNNKALEIYNPTSAAINLSGYTLFRANNGATSPSASFVMNGMLAPGGTYVIVNANAGATLIGKADTLNAITNYNGDDAIWLQKNGGDTLDIIGVIGVDPGTNWPVGILGATSEFTLVRKSTIQSGQTNWGLSVAEWDVFPQDFFDSLGTHLMQPCAPISAGCSDLFFAEYIEGSSSNKAMEIYNPTSSSVNLTNYVIYRNNNGSGSPTDSIHPQGMLAAGAVFVIGNASGNAAILAQSDTLHSLTFYNGDDAVWMKNKTTGDTLDIIGIIGNDPGTNWTVGAGATSEFTLVRKIGIQQGQKDWSIGATEWDVYPQNFTDSLGTHSMTPCGTVLSPEVAFVSSTLNVDESAGSVNVIVTLANFNNDTTRVDVMLLGGTAADTFDFTFVSPQTAVFPGGSGVPFTINIPIIDDAVQEPDETIILVLQNATNGATIGSNDTLVITINENDKPIPVYNIADIHGEDAAGNADSVNVVCELRGVVLGVNLRPSGLQFQMHDGTGGINVFSFSDNYGYTVVETDSIHVIGTIAQFRGLTEIIPDTVIYVSTGHMLPKVRVVSSLDESTESELVKVVGFWIMDTTQWTGSGSGFNVDITNGNDTLQIRIDNDNNLFGDPNPGTGLLNITGTGNQYNPSSSAPFLSGYQLFPRYREDIETTQAPVAGFTMGITGLAIDFTDTSTNCPIYWAWDFGDGNTDSIQQNPSHTYAAGGYYYVCLTAGNPAGSSTTCDSVYVEPVGIFNPNTDNKITVFPVPVSGILHLNSDLEIINIEVYNSVGQLIQIAANLNFTSLNFSNQSAGLYLLKIKTERGIVFSKILKQ